MKTVAIVGKCNLHLHLAPFDNPSIPIWSLNDELEKGYVPRTERIFDPHKPDRWDKPPYLPTHLDWLHQKRGIPIFMYRQYPEVPDSVQYPIDQVRERFFRNIYRGKERVRHYFSQAWTYAVALALLEGYERIETYGIEMAIGDDYQNQRENGFFWMGVADGMGVEFCVPGNSALFDPMLYGFKET